MAMRGTRSEPAIDVAPDGASAASGQGHSRPSEAPGEPEAYALLYAEAIRNLSAQESSLDELRGRAGVMLSAAGVVSAFLGSSTLTIASGLSTKPTIAATGLSTPGTEPWIVAIVYVLILIPSVMTVAAACFFVGLLPTRTWGLRVGIHELLGAYIEGDQPATMPEIHRSLAWWADASQKDNQPSLDEMYKKFGWGAKLFIGSLIGWIAALGFTVLVRLLV